MQKKGIYENFVASELIKKNYNLNYYKPIDSLELEFIIEKMIILFQLKLKFEILLQNH